MFILQAEEKSRNQNSYHSSLVGEIRISILWTQRFKEKKSQVHLSGPGHRCGTDLGEVTVSQAPERVKERRLSERGAPSICNPSPLEVNEEEQELCNLWSYSKFEANLCYMRLSRK